ncbi:MAG: hypothetical protein Q8S73_42825, partial [Deltaproteobacteria bacterium]|nr:hypothetical protein [Deltaproteobacteria bacterium]
GDELRAKLRELLMDLSKVTEGPLMRDLREEFERRGKLEGKLEGEASALLRVLARRGITIDDGTRARVLACSDAATLDAWLDRAATAADAAEVFGDGGA